MMSSKASRTNHFGMLDDRERAEVIRGDLHGHHALKSKIIRIFTSSTFSDTKVERDALMRDVYPRLKSYCRSLGLDFQIVDMRWGVRDEAVDEHLVAELCLAEIKLCQEISIGPQFVTFLGQKYGFRPLRDTISAQDFNALLGAIDDKEVRNIFYQWYKLDENIVPPSFLLQPISSILPHYYNDDPANEHQRETDREKWWQLQDLMTKALRRAARSVFKDRARVQDYLSSVTEIEIDQGIFQCPGNPNHHCWWLKREFSGLQKCVPFDTSTASYIDVIYGTKEVDKEAQSLLTMLKEDRIPAKYLGIKESNIVTYLLPWRSGGLDPEQHSDHAEYVAKFCNDFYRIMVDAIGSAHAAYTLHAGDAVYQEVLQHARFCKSKCDLFQGRDSLLKKVDSYLSSDVTHPLVIHGESGCGKTSIVAITATRLQKVGGPRCVLVLRFLGTTPASSTIRPLLSSICRQISRAYNQDDSAVPESYKDLVSHFSDVLKLASEELPLYVFLDSIDQLSDENDGRQAAWLPTKLPRHVHLVVSTLSGSKYKCLSALQLRLEKEFIEVSSLTSDECNQVFAYWLAKSQRTLTQRQSEFVLRRFKDCPLPLYLRLAFNEAIRWKSYSPRLVDDACLPATISATILSLFHRLEKLHGEIFVSHALGYITAAKDGLSEAELEDILSCDDQVLSDVYQYWTPSVRRLPPLLWSRVRRELGEFLVDSAGGDGSRTIRWYHRQFDEAARERYLADDDAVKARHSAIADFFQGRWVGVEKAWDLPEGGGEKAYNRMVAEQPLIYDDGDDFNYRKLTELPWNLAKSGRTAELEEHLLSNYEWLLTKLRATSISAVIADFAYVVPSVSVTKSHDSEGELRLIVEALRLASNAVNADPHHLSSQLVGRLMLLADKEQRPLVWKLFHQARMCSVPSLLPLLPCFPSPGGALQASLEGHRNFVSSVAMAKRKKSSDEIVLASGSWDGTVKIWDMDSGNAMETMKGHSDWVTGVAITGDGSHVVSSSADGTIRHWVVGSCESGPCGILRDHRGAVNAVAVTSDGCKTISGGDDKSLRVWNTDLESQVYGRVAFSLDGHTSRVTSLCLSRDDVLLVSGSKDKTARLWNVKLGNLLATFEGHSAAVTSVGIAGDEKQRFVVISGSDDCTARLWNVAAVAAAAVTTTSSTSPIVLSGHSDRIQAVDVTMATGIAVTGSVDRTIRVWRATTGDCIRTFDGHRGAVCALAVTPDLRHVISASADDTLRAWDLKATAPFYQLTAHTNAVTSVAVSPDGCRVSTSSLDSTAKLYVLDDSKLIDEKLLSGHVGSVECVVFSSDGVVVMTTSADHNLKLWDVATGRLLRTYCKHVDWVNAIVFVENDDGAVSVSDDGTVVVWNVATGRALRSWRAVDGYGDAVKTVDFVCAAANGRRKLIASGGTDCVVRVWDFESGVAVHAMKGHSKDVRHVKAVVRPAASVFSASRDKTIKMWSLDSGTCLKTFYGHALPVNVVVPLGDGEHILSGSSDKTLRLWSVASGACLAGMYVESGVTGLDVSAADRRRIVFGTNNGWVATAWLRLSENDDAMPVLSLPSIVPGDAPEEPEKVSIDEESAAAALAVQEESEELKSEALQQEEKLSKGKQEDDSVEETAELGDDKAEDEIKNVADTTKAASSTCILL